MKITNNVSEINQRAIDKIGAVLLNAYYKEHERYPDGGKIIINPGKAHMDSITATLFDDVGDITRKFNQQKLMERSEKLPKHGNFK